MPLCLRRGDWRPLTVVDYAARVAESVSELGNELCEPQMDNNDEKMIFCKKEL